jgi:hypothetical protein
MADEERKPRSVASINSAPTIERHASRIIRLREAIARHDGKGNADKVAELQAELDRRVAELTELRTAIDGAL